MSIFSTIGNAIKSAATFTYNTVNSIGSGIANAFSGGGNQTASAGMAFPVGAGMTPSQTVQANRVINSGGGGASGTTIPAGAIPAPRTTSATYGPTFGNGLNNYGGSGSATYGPSLPSFAQTPQTRSISANTLNSTYSPTSSFTSSSFAPSAPTSAPGTVAPLSVPSAPTPTNPGTVNNTNLASTVAPLYTYNPKTNSYDQVQQDQQNQSDQQVADAKQSLFDKILGKKENILQSPEIQQQNAVVQQQRQEVANQMAQLNAITAKQNQDLLQLRNTGSKEGVTETVYGGQQAQINYEAAVHALPIQASLSAAQGNLSLAQDYLKQLTDIKTEQVDNEYNYRKSLYESISTALDKNDQRRYDQLKTQDERTYQASRDFIKTQSDLLQSAVAQKAPSAIINAIASASTQQQAIVAAGQYAGDVVGQQYKVAQLQKLQQDIINSKPIDLSTAPAEAKPYLTAYNQASIGLPSQQADNARKSMAQAVASGDTGQLKQVVVNTIKQNLPISEQTAFIGRQQSSDSLKNIIDLTEQAKAKGATTGLIKGNIQEVSQKLGQTGNPDLVYIGTQMKLALNAYRKSVTGVAFNESELKQYKSIFPDLTNSSGLNLTTAKSLMDAFDNNNRSDYQSVLDPNTYNAIFSPQTVNLPSNSNVNPQVQSLRSKYNY